MSKRKLSKQQQNRIKKAQSRRVERAATNSSTTTQPLNCEKLGPEQPGLLIARYGATVDVEDKHGNIFHCHIRQHIEHPVPGDKVIWRQDHQQTGVVVAISRRSSVLTRLDQQNNLKPLAANITLMIIVIAPKPMPSIDVIDRYLVVAQLLNFSPLIIINKIDCVDTRDDQLTELISLYHHIGHRILKTSAKHTVGIDTLADILVTHTSIFVGQSGVGKSSLIKSLLPDVDIKIGQISETKNLGKHTTTTTRLYHFPNGGSLIDSPGVRRFNLWHADANDIIKGFIEFSPYIGRCKFRDCQHKNEPGCHITQAVKDGYIDPRRLASYHHLVEYTS